MELFHISDLVDIITSYVNDDIICDDILKMDWSQYVISKLKVSYLSYIVDKYPTKINNNILAENSNLTPDLIHIVRDNYHFKKNPLYPRDKLVNIRVSSRFTSYDICWENPNLPYHDVINTSHYIDWDSLGFNPILPYEFLKKHRDKINARVIAQHPNAGDLLLDEEIYLNEMIFCLCNPSLPFDKVPNIDSLLLDRTRGYCLLSNENLPIKYVRKCAIDRKLPTTIYRYNSNISKILEQFPIDSNTEHFLLDNPAYYTYCVGNVLKSLFDNM